MAISASIACTSWCWPMGDAERLALLRVGHATRRGSAASGPWPMAPMSGRVWLNVSIASLKPSPSGASRFALGTFTSSKWTTRGVARALAQLVFLLADASGRACRDRR